MRRLFAGTLLFAALPTIALAQPKFAPDPDPSKIQVLILTGQNVGEHLWRQTTPLLRQILEDTKKFEVRVIEEVRGVGPETFANYDLLVMNYYNRTAKEKWGERTERAFADFVRSGKGLVLYHVSLASFDGWTEFEQMSGGNWRPGKGLGQHSEPHDFTVDIKDHDHPITRGLKSFPVKRDELYANLQWQPASTYHVLATAWDDHALYKGKATQPTPGPGLDQPILWISEFGKGRVFHTTLGHFADAVRNLGFGVTFARGAEWAATGKVTLPIPPEMAVLGP
jgi:type 1 glutamine amidotransferase